MTTKEAIKYFGGKKELAEKLGIWPTAIAGWGKRPPMRRQYQLEKLTDGRLKADEE